MKFFNRLLILAIICISAIGASAQEKQRRFLSYYELSDYYYASPGAFKFGLYGFHNPAMTSYIHDADLALAVSQRRGDLNDFNNWGLFFGSENSSFGAVTTKYGGKSVTDYRYSLGFGDRSFSFGLGYGFCGGDVSAFGRSNIMKLGFLARPNRYLSIGFTETFALNGEDAETFAEIAVRPYPDILFTLYGDFAMFNDQNLEAAKWSAGASYEFIDGLRLSGRYFSDERMNVGVDVSLGRGGFGTQASFDKEGEYDYNSYFLRTGALDRSIFDVVKKDNDYVKLDLNGAIKYQKFIWFDDSKTLLDILRTLDLAKEKKSVRGVAVNASGMQCSYEIAWEIRNKLKELKEDGKKIVIFVDRASMMSYHFASVADKVILDPLGAIMLEGFSFGKSYYKKMLDNVGIGFEELRYFKYKSAAETFARDEMSEGDREQLQKLVDDWYEIMKQDVMESRELTSEEYENLINGKLLYTGQDAVDKKLADNLGRWLEVDDIIKEKDSGAGDVYDISALMEYNKPFDDKWGEPQSRIAIIYALGVCAMDQGIKARTLSIDLKKAIEDNSVKAIVLRVDSPGGDAMASDYIADLLKENAGKKPIIVSQGMLAASGGYWISMYGDKIVSSPLSLTGSIGVIGSWIYDKGLKDSLGISTDLVKRGKFADLGHSYSLPFIGIGLPVRNLNDEEREILKNSIMDSYKLFVEKVAEGRDMEYDEVDEIAQGRIWTGYEAEKIGLVDKLGGLSDAINLAKSEAGIDMDEDVAFVEFPKQTLFDFGSLLPKMIGVDVDIQSDKLDALMFRVENFRSPMPILPLDYLDLMHEE